MKKIFSAIISSPLKGRLGGVLFALLATTTLWAYDFQSGDLYYNITSSSAPYTVEVTRKTSSYPYNDWVTFTTITIPKTVTYGGITYSVTSIGEDAFCNCSSLTSVTLGNSVTSIGEDAFCNCSSLTSVTLGNSVTSIGSSAFYGCSSLTSITIPNGVTSIGEKAFYECSSLTSITIPNSVTSIGACTFESCSSLSSITIPNSVTSIGDRAFRKCSSLTSITIPNSVTSVGGAVFHSCSALKSVVLSENITSLETITISSGKGFGWYGFFEDCSSLTSITIPKNMEFMDEDTFDDCSSLKSIVWNAKNCKSSIFDDSYVSSQITSFVIGKDVEHIPAGLCQGMKLIPSITIPSGVKNIGDRAFSGCSSLVTMVVESDNTVYDSRNHCNAIVETATNKLIAGCQNTIIPNSVTSIGEYAFYNCSSLTSVTLGNSVTSIGEYAFHQCYSLTSITIPNSVTSIGEYAFYDCSSLTSVTLGNSVTSIGKSAFYDCSSLTSVTLGNSVTSIGDSAFRQCYSLTSITIPNSVTSIGEDAFYDCSSLTSVTLGNSVTSIGEYAFYDCSSLTSMTIPNSVTSIGKSAFYACESLISVFLEPNTPPTLGKNNFTASTICYIPCGTLSAYESSTWEEIVGRFVEQCGDSSTFNKCGNDLYWEYRNSTLAITGTGDMYDYTVDSSAPWHNFSEQIKCITIGNCVTSIGNYAFCDCSSLDSISVYAITPPKFGNSGNLLTSSPTCYIPCGTLAAYQSSSWAEQVGSFVEQCNEPVKCGDNLYWTYANGTLTITGTGTMYNYDDMDNLAPWNSIRNNIKNIVLPEGLTSIGDWAFYLCSYVTSISIPEEVTNIGDRAFQYCNSLTSVIWNAENCDDYWVTESYRPFYDCSQITSFTFGDSVKHIPAYLCYDMNNLTSIVIPNSVTSIGKRAFYGCSGLTSVAIPHGVTSIGSGAFQYCNSLISVTWNAENCADFSEGYYTFYTTESQMTSFIFGDNVKHIPAYLCYDMNNLTSIDLPNSVTSIGEQAFCLCSGLTSVTIPNSVTSIGERAFYGCWNLTSIIWNAENCTNFSDSFYAPFYGCTAQITSFTFGDSVKHIPAYLCYDMNNLTSIAIPNSVTSVEGDAFYACSSLDSISVEATTPPTLGGYSFSSSPICYIPCGTLSAYQSSAWAEQVGSFVEQCDGPIVDANKCGDNLYWAYTDGTLTITGTGAMYDYWYDAPWWKDLGLNIKTILLPQGLTSIGEYAFWDLQNLTSVVIPEGVTSIGKGSFSVCQSLKFINIPNSVMNIGDNAFSSCESLQSINIPNGLTTISRGVFKNCPSLTSVTIPNSVTTIKNSAFYNCSLLATITIPSNMSTIENGAFYGCSSLDSISIEATNPPVLSGSSTFSSSPVCYIPCGTLAVYQSSSWAEQVGSFVEQCDEPVETNKCGDNLYWAYADSTLTITGTGAMYDYWFDAPWWEKLSSYIKTIALPQGLTSIGEYAFWDLQNLTSVVIPEGVTSIGKGSFSVCQSLKFINIPNSVMNIGDDAFRSCESLQSINIPNGITMISRGIFKNCPSLTSVIIPNSVTIIKNSAFYNCSLLSSIIIPNSVTTIENGAFFGCSSIDSVLVEATTPPTLGGNSFSSSPTCYIPCGTLAAYQSSSWAQQVGSFIEQCDDNNDDQSLISVTDGTLSDWDNLPMEYLFETKCVEGASWDALKSVKVYADLTYINLVVEWDTEIVTDLSSVPFHVYLNVDNDAPTGGWGGLWLEPYNIDVLLEGYFYLDGNPCTYQPDVALYAGTPLADEWAWDWTTIEALAASQLITKGVMEIQIEYGKLPVKLENTFTVGFSILQSWNSVGVLPNAAADEVGNMIPAEKMLVKINNVNAPTSIENTHSPSSITNTQKLLRNGQLIILHDGKTYTVMGAEIK